MSQVEVKPENVLARPPEAWESPPPGEEQKEEEEAPFSFEEAPPPKADLSQARLFATEPRPAGFGEVLVTDVWSRAIPREPKAPAKTPDFWQGQVAPVIPDRQREWEARQELRELGLLKERPMVSYDARYETYWKQVMDATPAGRDAIVDPYTHFVAEFADADLDSLRDHRVASREYGKDADSLLALGRAYWAIGRHKGARAVLAAAAKAERLHPAVWYNLGVVQLLSRASKNARQVLEEAVDQAPGDFRAELALAVACYHQRDYAAAEEQFRRLAGSTGLRATARSMLACSQRMQGNWDGARVELGFLKDAKPGDWGAMSQQCLDCVERGEQKLIGALRARRRSGQMWRALAGTAAGGVWVAYSLTENLFKREMQWAVVPLFVLALLVVRSLKRISGRELPGEFGNAEQGLICWQSTSWMRPRQAEF